MPLPKCYKDKDLRTVCKLKNLLGKRNREVLRVGIELKEPR